MAAGAQGPGPTSTTFAGHRQRARSEVEQPGLGRAPTLNTGATGGGLACCAMVPAPATVI